MAKIEDVFFLLNDTVADESQKKAVFKQDNTVVSAGAGSGKTFVLASRYVYLLLKNEDIEVKNILALTFTRKAAAEIYQRIYLYLLKYYRALDEKEFPDEKRRIKRAINDFPSARIQTLDSYSAEIVRKASLRLGLSPSFSVASSGNATIPPLVLSFVFRNKDRRAIVKFFPVRRTLEDIANNFFLKIIEKTTSLATPSSYFSSCFEKQQMLIIESFDEIERDLNNEILSVFSLLENVKIDDKFINQVSSSMEGLSESSSSIPFECPSLESEEIREEFGKIIDGLYDKVEKFFSALMTKQTLGKKDESVISFKKAVKQKRDVVAKLQTSVASIKTFLSDFEILKDMNLLLDELLKIVNEEKRSSLSLSFKDISELALKVLLNEKDIREEEKKSIRKIMIDEFQDNNRRDKNILFLLSERDDLYTEKKDKTDYEFFKELERNISEDKLFFVGDEKQSIYKFRGADVSVFNELKNTLKGAEGSTSKLSMTNNYRSSSSLLASFNKMFGEKGGGNIDSTVLPSLFYHPLSIVEDYDALYENATKNSSLPEEEEGNIRVHAALLFDDENYGEEKDLNRALGNEETCAFFIAKKILEITGGGREKYGNIAILEKDRSKRSALLSVLSSFSIPYNTDQANDIFSEAVINDFYFFLRLLVYPLDTLALLSVLSSPFFSLSMAALENIAASKDSFDPDTLSEGEKEKYLKALESIDEKRSKLFKEGLLKTLESLWYDTGYYHETLINKTLYSYKDHFDLLYESARLSIENGESVESFISSLEKQKSSSFAYSSESGTDFKNISYPTEKDDAVQIMTIHQSKGLEFSHVFVKGIFTTPRDLETKENFFFDEYSKDSSGVSFTLGTNKSNFFSIRAKDDNREREKAEQKRLLYVAITRAKEDCFLVGSLGKTGALNEFDVKEKNENQASNISLMHKIARYYYKDQIYADNDYSYEKDVASPSFHLPRAPFDFIKLNPVSTKVIDKREDIKRVREEKIKLFSPFYSLPSPPLPEDQRVETESPSFLERYECEKIELPSFTPLKEFGVLDGIIKLEEGSFNPTEFGNLFHLYMQTFITTGEKLKKEDVDTAALSEEETETVFSVLSSMCDNFLKTEIGKNALKAKEENRVIKAEDEFKAKIEGAVFTGFIDLFFQSEDGNYTIIDYKTDRTVDPSIYIYQQSCYREVLSSLMDIDKESITTYLYFPRFDKVIDITSYTYTFSYGEIKKKRVIEEKFKVN